MALLYIQLVLSSETLLIYNIYKTFNSLFITFLKPLHKICDVIFLTRQNQGKRLCISIISRVTKISLPFTRLSQKPQTLECYNNVIKDENFITGTN